jgi:F-type H+-transporting ATPase subunit gamma
MGATEDLQSVVRTMKALAAVNIRQYEEAARALADYRATVELALRAVLRHAQTRPGERAEGGGAAVLIVVGSDQGMCGQFNEAIAAEAAAVLGARGRGAGGWRVLAIGERVANALVARGWRVDARRHLPSSSHGVSGQVRALLGTLERWQAAAGGLSRVILTHNRAAEAGFEGRRVVLLPMDAAWLARLEARAWPTRALPMVGGDPDRTLSHLVQQYLFVELFAGLAQSLAAENATRLRAMQSAEKNVEERLDELETRFNRQRQNSITSELLDVISGSEAVMG